MTAPLRRAALALSVLTLAGTAALGQTPCGGTPTGGLPGDCVLELGGITLGFDFTPDPADGRRGTLTVTQATAEGGSRDVTGPFEMIGQLAAPLARDLDGDGLPELLVQSRPTAFDVWLQGPEGFFRSAGRISARAPGDIEARGALTVAAVREAGGGITETAYILDAGQVSTVFRMRIDPERRTCTLMGAGSAAQDWLNADVLIADCEARDWD